MEIALHLGVHLTDEDKLLRCLMRNRPLLAEQGIAIPGPGSYRRQLRQLANDMRAQQTDANTQEALLDGILEEDEVRRVVFSSENFLAVHKWAISQDRFYPQAGERVANLRHLFPDAQVHAYVAIRNPASFLPALAVDDRAGGMDSALKNVDPATLHWSEMLARIRTEAPDVPITVWCDEDVPLLWPEILRAVAGHDPQTELEGWMAWYWGLIPPKAHAALRRYFGSNKITDDAHRRQVLRAMISRFADPEDMETPAALPGWTDDYTEVLTEIYDQDLDLIASMPGVTLLEP